MSIQLERRSHWFAKRETSTINPSNVPIHMRGNYPGREVTFSTPNIAIDRDDYFPDRPTIYERNAIPEYKSQLGIEWFLGRYSVYRWTEGAKEEDIKFEVLEKQLTDHPLVGQIMAAYLGSEKEGIHRELLEKDPSWRVEIKAKGKKLVTVDYAYRKILVEAGKNAQVHSQNWLDPVLRVCILDAPYQGQRYNVQQNSLRLVQDMVPPSKLKQSDNRGSVSSDKDRYYDNNFLDNWLSSGVVELASYLSDNQIIPNDQALKILKQAATKGLDLSVSVPIAVIKAAGVQLPVIAEKDSSRSRSEYHGSEYHDDDSMFGTGLGF